MHEPVTLRELGSTRALPEVRAWVEGLCARYKSDPVWNDYFVAKRGLTNRLQGELLPLAHLCDRLAKNWPRHYLTYFTGTEQSFDAHILAEDRTIVDILEVTLACDGHRDSIAGEYLKKYGFVPLWTALSYSGHRGSRELPFPKFRSMKADQIVEDGLVLVRDAVAAKSNSRKYKHTSLVVGLEDSRLLDHDFEYFSDELRKIQSEFQLIYYVGMDGRFFLEYRTQV